MIPVAQPAGSASTNGAGPAAQSEHKRDPSDSPLTRRVNAGSAQATNQLPLHQRLSSCSRPLGPTSPDQLHHNRAYTVLAACDIFVHLLLHELRAWSGGVLLFQIAFSSKIAQSPESHSGAVLRNSWLPCSIERRPCGQQLADGPAHWRFAQRLR